MLEDYSAQVPQATWNSVRGVWETNRVNLLCEHLEPFLETWPTSGMMRDGRVFELPTRERLINGSVSSLSPIPEDSFLRTPAAVEGDGGTMSESKAKAEGRTVLVRYQAAEIAYNNGLKVQDSVADSLIPTTSARDFKDGRAEHMRDGKIQTDTVARAVINGDEVSETSWGKFEPAIRRWEAVIGRKAPAPTKPDGRDETHRLSSKFTEWMMGLPEGWITDVGLKRNDELKACGNGVVPQQAELALLSLLHGIDVEGSDKVVHLPTPTVSDMYTADLKSSQMSDGSMHSVSLPRAVNMIVKEGE